MTNRRREDDRLEPLWREAARNLDDRAGAAASCVEAETLAAWAEHRLGAAEAGALERHAAGCPRCRALLAAFTTTAPAPMAAAPWWRMPLIRWAAPAAAVAAAAIVWVSVERLDPADMQETGKAADVLASAQPPPLEGPLPATPSQQAIDAVTSAPAPPRAAAAPAPPAPVQDLRRETPSAAAGRSRAAEAPEPDRPAAVAETVAIARAPGAAFSSGVLELTTPDTEVRWRIHGGLAERSADAGVTWKSTPLPAPGPYTAGACPSADVCWLAGAGGLVLRTTDGSAWTTAARPDAADLTAVAAGDALRAEVTTADGRVFVTADGGRTWALRPPLQESPAAPF